MTSPAEVEALRAELAAARNYQDAIASFVRVVQTEVVAVWERDQALARLDAVRALLPDADHGPRCSAWGSVPVYGMGVGANVTPGHDCDCLLRDIRDALDPTEGAP